MASSVVGGKQMNGLPLERFVAICDELNRTRAIDLKESDE